MVDRKQIALVTRPDEPLRAGWQYGAVAWVRFCLPNDPHHTGQDGPGSPLRIHSSHPVCHDCYFFG